MLTHKRLQHIVDIIEYFLMFFIIVIVSRLLILSIDIDSYRDDLTGKLSEIGKNIKFVQMLAEKVTDPILNPFRDILANLMKTSDLELVNILAPVFVIIVTLLIAAFLKLIAPRIVLFYERRINR